MAKSALDSCIQFCVDFKLYSILKTHATYFDA